MSQSSQYGNPPSNGNRQSKRRKIGRDSVYIASKNPIYAYKSLSYISSDVLRVGAVKESIFERRQRYNKEFAAEVLHLSVEGNYDSSDEEFVDDVRRALERNRQCSELRSFFTALCIANGLPKAPDECVTRWFMTNKLKESMGIVKFPPNTPEEVCRPVPTTDPIIPYFGAGDVGLEFELEKSGLCRKLSCSLVRSLENKARHSLRLIFHSSQEAAIDDVNQSIEVTHDTDASNGYSLSLKNRELTVRISDEKRDKLFESYVKLGHPEERFDTMLLLLLLRYSALSGEGYQAAVSPEVFRTLEESLGVSCECFASPLNSHLKTYFSAYPDIDRFFGSSGSFFEISSQYSRCGGSFEANPPFIEEIMLAMVLIFEYNLSRRHTPFSFFVFIPAWSDTPAFRALSMSKYCRFERIYSAKSHSYVTGGQHLPEKSGVRISYSKTAVFILQNDLGMKKWPISKDAIVKFEDSFTKFERK